MLSEAALHYEQDFGSFRTIILTIIYKYLDCGILEHGFASHKPPRKDSLCCSVLFSVF